MQTWEIPRSKLVQVNFSNYFGREFLTPNLPLQKILNQLNVSGLKPIPWHFWFGHPNNIKENEKEKAKYEVLQNVATRTNRRERKLVRRERRRTTFFFCSKEKNGRKWIIIDNTNWVKSSGGRRSSKNAKACPGSWRENEGTRWMTISFSEKKSSARWNPNTYRIQFISENIQKNTEGRGLGFLTGEGGRRKRETP